MDIPKRHLLRFYSFPMTRGPFVLLLYSPTQESRQRHPRVFLVNRSIIIPSLRTLPPCISGLTDSPFNLLSIQSISPPRLISSPSLTPATGRATIQPLFDFSSRTSFVFLSLSFHPDIRTIPSFLTDHNRRKNYRQSRRIPDHNCYLLIHPPAIASPSEFTCFTFDNFCVEFLDFGTYNLQPARTLTRILPATHYSILATATTTAPAV